MHNLTEDEHALLIETANRLEAATSRLEDMATSHPESPQALPQQTTESSRSVADAAGASSRDAAPSAPLPPPPTPRAEPEPQMIEEYDSLIESTVVPFTKQAEALGGVIAQQVARDLYHSTAVTHTKLGAHHLASIQSTATFSVVDYQGQETSHD